MGSLEDKYDIESEPSLHSIAEYYLEKLNEYQKGDKVYLNLPAVVMDINPDKLRKHVTNIINKFEQEKLSEDEAISKLWFGKAKLIIIKPEVSVADTRLDKNNKKC